MHQDDIIDVLNDLIETSRDGQFEFQNCAEHIKLGAVREVLLARAIDCQLAASELQALVTQCGGKPDKGGTVIGAIHRRWVTVRGALAGFTDLRMLQECERGENIAKAHYQMALEKPLPEPIRSVVERQHQGVLRNHEQIRLMRDQCRQAA